MYAYIQADIHSNLHFTGGKKGDNAHLKTFLDVLWISTRPSFVYSCPKQNECNQHADAHIYIYIYILVQDGQIYDDIGVKGIL